MVCLGVNRPASSVMFSVGDNEVKDRADKEQIQGK